MQLSILVVSRTAELVNRFCAGLDAACSLAPMEAEILVSWNGSDADEQLIVNTSATTSTSLSGFRTISLET